MDLAKSPFVNTVLRQNLAETKVLTLRLGLSLICAFCLCLVLDLKGFLKGWFS